MDLTSLTQHLTASNSTKISLRWKGLCLFKYWKALIHTNVCIWSWWSEGCAAVVLILELIRLRNVTRFSAAVRPGSLASLGIIISDHLIIIITLKLNSDNCRVLSWWTEPGISRLASPGLWDSPPGGLVEIFPELMTESESDMDLMAINWMIILHVKNGETKWMMERTLQTN